MKERAVISSFTITSPFEIKHFQMKIPRDAVEIIGVETSVRTGFGNFLFLQEQGHVWTSNNIFLRNILFGNVTLQSAEKGNIFYCGELRERDHNFGHLDYTLRRGTPTQFIVNGIILNNPDVSIYLGCELYRFSPFAEYCLASRKEETTVRINGDTTIVSGVYRDMTGVLLNDAFKYEAKIILWYNT